MEHGGHPRGLAAETATEEVHPVGVHVNPPPKFAEDEPKIVRGRRGLVKGATDGRVQHGQRAAAVGRPPKEPPPPLAGESSRSPFRPAVSKPWPVAPPQRRPQLTRPPSSRSWKRVWSGPSRH